MKNVKRELPVIKIEGTEFLGDVMKEELREKGNESNSISWNHLKYKNPYYLLAYDKTTKNANKVRPWQTNVRINEFIQIDPIGMAEKYNMPLNEISHKNDHDLRISQPAWANRVIQDILPVIDVAGVWYRVDLKNERLQIIEGIGEDIQLKDMPELIPGQRYFYYDPKQKAVLDLATICKRLPDGVVKVSLPSDQKLDPVAVAHRECHDHTDYVMKHPINQVLKAKVISIEKVDLKNELEINKQRAKWIIREGPLLIKNRDSNGRGKSL